MSSLRHRSRSAYSRGNEQSLPPVAAAFIVQFDQREGYKLTASKSLPDVEIEGVVDFKSLPSGLHNVKKDLVYFIHGDHAGISAFVNAPGDASQRNAQMLAVGALVPLSHGRLGKSWRHARELEEMASENLSSSERLRMLEEYWERNKRRDDVAVEEDGTDPSPMVKFPSISSHGIHGYRRSRAMSDPVAFTTSSHTLSSHHPAASLPKLLHDFGPLIFPLYRAALLRKRILLLGDPPVQQNCNFVYDLSILSSVPTSLLSLLPVDSIPPLRLQALFNVGVQDIPKLQPPPKGRSSSEFPPSWLACTTDDILATKPDLYDMLVNLYSASSSSPSSSTSIPLLPTHIQTTSPYPKIYPSSPELSRTLPRIGLKATQRDLRRYLALHSSLSSFPSAKQSSPPSNTMPIGRGRTAPSAENGEIECADAASIRSTSTSSSSLSPVDEVVEPQPWALIAYNSYLWWASAGEKKSGLSPDDEDDDGQAQQDRALLLHGAEVEGGVEEGEVEGEGSEGLTKEMAIVAFFHRLTALLFTGISDAISRVDGESVRRNNMPKDLTSGAAEAEDGNGDRDEDEEEVDQDEGGEDENAPLLTRQSIDRSPGDQVESSTHEPEMEPPDVEITSADMTAMGLDVWSSSDRSFVEELMMMWWGRRAVVTGGVVQCCGVRIL